MGKKKKSVNDITCAFYFPQEGRFCSHYVDPYTIGECGFCTLPKKFRCEEELKTKQPPLSVSAINDWISCKMKYKFHYLDGIRVRDEFLGNALKHGKAWDSFMNYTSMNVSEEFMAEMLTELAEQYKMESYHRAILSALMKAFIDLEIVTQKGESQQKYSMNLNDNIVTGVLDHVLEDGTGFKERKLSTQPDFYLKMENIHTQCGTYFMLNPEFEYVDMEITRMPQLRTGEGRNKNETIDAFVERVYSDIIGRPSYYFVGYNRENKTFGKRFWRKEFDLKYLTKMYGYILREIRETIDRGSWYRNDKSCFVPYQCQFYDIKKSGVVSNTLYYYAGDKETEGEDDGEEKL